MSHDAVKQNVAYYYSEKLKTYGLTHQGVDWNSSESQQLRFKQLLRGFDITQSFSITDYGCGYGALVDYLMQQQLDFQYAGHDLSASMVEAAQNAYRDKNNVRFLVGDQLEPADYTVASGIFNTRMEQPDQLWADYIKDCLYRMDQASHRGFSFNILTLYSDPLLRRTDLYYADPGFWFDWCKRHFSRNVALFHDYNLYEFTISVLKPTD